MAKQVSLEENQLAMSGYIVLTRPMIIQGKMYTKVWAPFWDIFLKKDIPKVEGKNPANWDWHCVWDDKVQFHINGGKVQGFEPDENPNLKDKEMFIPDIIRKVVSKVERKAKDKVKKKVKE